MEVVEFGASFRGSAFNLHVTDLFSCTCALLLNILTHETPIHAPKVLLNLNVLCSPDSLRRPFEAWAHADELATNERLSLALTFILGLLNFVGCETRAALREEESKQSGTASCMSLL